MSQNVGMLDRVLRIVAGLALIALALGWLPGFAASAWGWIGVVPLATAAMGSCPLYSIFGLSTCGRRA